MKKNEVDKVFMKISIHELLFSLINPDGDFGW